METAEGTTGRACSGVERRSAAGEEVGMGTMGRACVGGADRERGRRCGRGRTDGGGGGVHGAGGAGTGRGMPGALERVGTMERGVHGRLSQVRKVEGIGGVNGGLDRRGRDGLSTVVGKSGLYDMI